MEKINNDNRKEVISELAQSLLPKGKGQRLTNLLKPFEYSSGKEPANILQMDSDGIITVRSRQTSPANAKSLDDLSDSQKLELFKSLVLQEMKDTLFYTSGSTVKEFSFNTPVQFSVYGSEKLNPEREPVTMRLWQMEYQPKKEDILLSGNFPDRHVDIALSTFDDFDSLYNFEKAIQPHVINASEIEAMSNGIDHNTPAVIRHYAGQSRFVNFLDDNDKKVKTILRGFEIPDFIEGGLLHFKETSTEDNAYQFEIGDKTYNIILNPSEDTDRKFGKNRITVSDTKDPYLHPSVDYHVSAETFASIVKSITEEKEYRLAGIRQDESTLIEEVFDHLDGPRSITLGKGIALSDGQRFVSASLQTDSSGNRKIILTNDGGTFKDYQDLSYEDSSKVYLAVRTVFSAERLEDFLRSHYKDGETVKFNESWRGYDKRGYDNITRVGDDFFLTAANHQEKDKIDALAMPSYDYCDNLVHFLAMEDVRNAMSRYGREYSPENPMNPVFHITDTDYHKHYTISNVYYDDYGDIKISGTYTGTHPTGATKNLDTNIRSLGIESLEDLAEDIREEGERVRRQRSNEKEFEKRYSPLDFTPGNEYKVRDEYGDDVFVISASDHPYFEKNNPDMTYGFLEGKQEYGYMKTPKESVQAAHEFYEQSKARLSHSMVQQDPGHIYYAFTAKIYKGIYEGTDKLFKEKNWENLADRAPLDGTPLEHDIGFPYVFTRFRDNMRNVPEENGESDRYAVAIMSDGDYKTKDNPHEKEYAKVFTKYTGNELLNIIKEMPKEKRDEVEKYVIPELRPLFDEANKKDLRSDPKGVSKGDAPMQEEASQKAAESVSSSDHKLLRDIVVYYAFDRSFTDKEIKELTRNGAGIFEEAVSHASGHIEPSLIYGKNTYIRPPKSTWLTYSPGTKIDDGRFVGENDNFVLVDFNGDGKELQLFRKMSDNQARELLKEKGYSEEASENYAYLSTSKNTYSPMYLLAERMRREDHLKINVPTRYNEDIPSKEQVAVVLKKITDVMGDHNEIDFTGPFHDSNDVITGIKRDAAGKLYFKAKSPDFGEYDRPLLRVPDGKLNTSVRPADIYADILAVEFKEVAGKPDKAEHFFKTPYEFPVPNGEYDTWENAQIKSAEIFHSPYADGHDGIRLRDTDGNEYAFNPNIHVQSLDVLERFDKMITAIRTDNRIEKVINSERSIGRWHQGENRTADGEEAIKDDVPLQNGESQKESENTSLSDQDEVSKENEQEESQERHRGLHL